ncbi:MAG: hypothetical protein KME13_10180 [Myxacorys californica WJT36-NPBG1]|jgi:uncharacterized protein YjbJ (UPF0337 family)|nr:hypothetical protein [Myxacorys californica WJT36-NPBG1]
MKLNYLTKTLSMMGRWIVTTLFCVSAIAFVWQGAFFSNTSALASPAATLIADAGSKAEGKVNEFAGDNKSFVRDVKDKVQDAAKSNAAKVDQATDDDNPIAGKAKRDAARIQKRAEEDATRTQEAIDNNKNVVERAVEGIKDAFGN